MAQVEDGKVVAAINRSSDLARRGIRAETGETFGALVFLGAVTLGIWSYFDGAYRFRTLANWNPLVYANSLEDIISATRNVAEAKTVTKARLCSQPRLLQCT